MKETVKLVLHDLGYFCTRWAITGVFVGIAITSIRDAIRNTEDNIFS